jgi:hypothetical protein
MSGHLKHCSDPADELLPRLVINEYKCNDPLSINSNITITNRFVFPVVNARILEKLVICDFGTRQLITSLKRGPHWTLCSVPQYFAQRTFRVVSHMKSQHKNLPHQVYVAISKCPHTNPRPTSYHKNYVGMSNSRKTEIHTCYKM